MATIVQNKKNNKRKYPEVKGRRPDLKEIRCEEALERTLAWQKLSPEEQLKSLDRRGHAAKKQRARITALLNK